MDELAVTATVLTPPPPGHPNRRVWGGGYLVRRRPARVTAGLTRPRAAWYRRRKLRQAPVTPGLVTSVRF